MIIIKGQYFDGKSSTARGTALAYDDHGVIRLAYALDKTYQITDLNISQRIGSTTRYITLADGGQFKTRDNDAIDQMCRDLKYQNRQGLVHYLGSRKRYVALTLLVVVVFMYSLVKWGVPAMSRQIAMSLSPDISIALGNGVEQYMEDTWLEPSELSEQRQSQLISLFIDNAKRSHSSIPLNIKFRKGGIIGANAFALPNGVIVITDDLIKLAQEDAEIEAIMMHEIGHVVHRHTLRFAIRQFGLTLLAMTLTGDVSSSSSFVVALPGLLVSQGYSREMEREADDYAFEMMLEAGIDTEHFAAMMERLDALYSDTFFECIEEDKFRQQCLDAVIHSAQDPSKTESVMERYLSTHPVSQERIDRFRKAGGLKEK